MNVDEKNMDGFLGNGKISPLCLKIQANSRSERLVQSEIN